MARLRFGIKMPPDLCPEPEPPGCIFCFQPVNAQHRYDCLTEKERRREERARLVAGSLPVMFRCGVIQVQPGTLWHRMAVRMLPPI